MTGVRNVALIGGTSTYGKVFPFKIVSLAFSANLARSDIISKSLFFSTTPLCLEGGPVFVIFVFSLAPTRAFSPRSNPTFDFRTRSSRRFETKDAITGLIRNFAPTLLLLLLEFLETETDLTTSALYQLQLSGSVRSKS